MSRFFNRKISCTKRFAFAYAAFLCAASHALAAESIPPAGFSSPARASLADSNGPGAAGSFKIAPLPVDPKPPSLTDLLNTARRGNAQSQYAIAMLYFNGNSLPKNYIVASDWLLRSAEQGNVDAQGQLGIMYMKGYGVQRNILLAYKWIGLASISGNQDWIYYREMLETSMSTDARNIAQAIVARSYSQISTRTSYRTSPATAQSKEVAWSGTLDETKSVPAKPSSRALEPYFGETKQQWQAGCKQDGAIIGSGWGFCVMNVEPQQ